MAVEPESLDIKPVLSEKELPKPESASETDGGGDQATGGGNSSTATNTDDESSSVTEEPRHQLQMGWKFWYFENSKDRAWEDCLKVVSPFETVEDFWSIYNNIKSASDLRTGCSYFVFKDGIKPMWEDPGNRKGGRWLVNFDKRQRHNLDNYWLEVLLCLIGEAFEDDGDEICGAVVDCRMKQDKISIWTADCTHKDAIWKIGQKIKERLSLYNGAMTYESHEATASKTGSMVKPMLTL